MAKPLSILGTVETKEIKLGAGRTFRGGASATFAGSAKFDSNSLGSGATLWEDLAAIAQDATITSKANMYKYTSGVPGTFKKGFVTGRDAQLSFTMDEFKSRNIQTILGLNNPINKLALGLMTVAASPAPTSSVFTVDTVTSYNAGDEIVVDPVSGGLATSTNSGIISSIATLAITMRQSLRDTPVAGWVAKKRMSTKLPFGGSDVATFPLLFVVDFVVDKRQFVCFMPKVSSDGNFNPALGGGTKQADAKVTFDM